MGRFIIWVLDGFGIGAMEDAAQYRAVDADANTCLHVLEKNPELYLPNLEKLGLMNALGCAVGRMQPNPDAAWGRSKLMHEGADTFYGHQEIVGTNPRRGKLELLSEAFEDIAAAVRAAGYPVREYPLPNGARVMGIADAILLSDNPANDPGQTMSMIGLSHILPEAEIFEIGRLVRANTHVARLIVHACNALSYAQMESQIHEASGGRGGVDIVALDVYDKNLCIRHMGYGVDETKQAPYLLGKAGVRVSHIGKFADIVANPYGERNISCVDTAETIAHLLSTADAQDEGLICVNVQETDLSGHRQNPQKFAAVLSLVDDGLGALLTKLNPQDRLVVMADHGNDPTNGSTLHSREYVPILLYAQGIRSGCIGTRETMSDVGASAFSYFRQQPRYRDALAEAELGNGQSFLDGWL